MGRDFLVLGSSLFPVQGCPYSMDLNADLTYDDKWLLNNVLKEVFVTPIQLAYYHFFFLHEISF